MALTQVVRRVLRGAKADLLKLPNVTGVAVGHKVKGGKRTDEIGIVVYVARKRPLAALKPSEVIPSNVSGVQTDVQQNSFRLFPDVGPSAEDPATYRPAPGGCSVGHYQITAGTLGAWLWVEGVGTVLLSNNHVLADSNLGAQGDNILQPGPYDGGKLPIATLWLFKEINFEGGGGGPDLPDCPVGDFFAKSANAAASLAGRQTRLKAYRPQAEGDPNYVDAALAIPVNADVVRSEVLEIGPVGSFASEDAFTLDTRVKKRGRTTRLTKGKITGIDASVRVQGYQGNKVALFEDQVLSDIGSAGGDSGSTIFLDGEAGVLCGLLFAGGDGLTVFNRIDRVVEAFPGLRVG